MLCLTQLCYIHTLWQFSQVKTVFISFKGKGMISISERKRFANQGKTLITAIWWAFKASSAIYVSKWFNNIHVNTEKKHCVSLIFLSNEKWTMRWKQMTILSDYHVAVVQSLMPWFIRTLVFLTVKLQLYRDVSWFMVPHRYKTWNFYQACHDPQTLFQVL